MARSRARGFTLIELMVVVGIVGVLASVAIPSFIKFSLRAKVAERATIMLRIKQAVQDYYVQNGTAVPASSGGLVVSGYNPPFPPQALKRAMSTAMPGWNVYFSAPGGGSSLPVEIEGAVYYSYYFQVEDTGPASTIQVYAAGDLDGDGIVSWRYTFFTRVGGTYQTALDFPGPGFEDDGTYGSF